MNWNSMKPYEPDTQGTSPIAGHVCGETETIMIRRMCDGEPVCIPVCEDCRADYGDDDLSNVLRVC